MNKMTRLFRADHPLSHRNAFVMMPFKETEQHHAVLETVRQELKYYGFEALRADEKIYYPNLWDNVRLYMDGCNWGIAIFDKISDNQQADQTTPPVFNPNVSLEVGYMLAKGKSCLLLKDKRLSVLQSDLSGKLYKEFDFSEIQQTVRARVKEWMRDSGVLPSTNERLLVFVSIAGIDRCAMAKAILTWSIWPKGGHKMVSRLRIESAGVGWPSLATPRKSAMDAIKGVCAGEDLMAKYKTQILSDMLKTQACLILVMTDSLKNGLPPKKTFTINEFFGGGGDIVDPAPDRGNDDSQSFKHTAAELKRILCDPKNLDRLDEFLSDPSLC